MTPHRGRASLSSILRTSAGAAAIGAGLVGAGEAVFIWVVASLGIREGFALLAYAAGTHAVLGLVAGVMLAPVLRVLAARINLSILSSPAAIAGTCAALVVGMGIVVVGGFRLMRDGGLSFPLAMLAGCGAAIVLMAVTFLQVRFVAARLHGRLGDVAVLATVAMLVAGRMGLSVAPAQGVDPVGSGSTDRPNVILVVVDTLRADVTGPYRDEADSGESLTPNLDRFTEEAVLFERMYASATWTRPAVASILTGLLPSRHGVTQKADPLPADLPNIATELRKAGYSTAATVTNVNLAPDFGFGHGFDAYRYHGPVRPLGATGPAVRLSLVNAFRLAQEKLSGRLVTDRFYSDAPKLVADALQLLDGLGDGPFFLWTHFMDPHDPFLRRPWDGSGVARVRDPHPDPARAEEMRALYEQEVRYWDESFGVFLEELEQRGRLDDTLILVTADHGEEFQDHGGYWHGQTLYEELSRVPLIVRLPGAARAGEVHRGLVSQLDLAPTILAAVGVEIPPGMQGLDLFSGTLPEDRSVVMEEDHDGNVLSGIVVGWFKYVVSNADNPRGFPTEQLFDLQEDPAERHNLAEERPDDAARLARALTARLEGGGRAASTRKGVQIDEALEEDLRALGYVQ